jgi:hypothetical protein
MDKPTELRPLTWIDADDWRATAERGQCFTIADDASNDIADVYHNDHASVTTTPEQAAAYCRMFAAAPDMVTALINAEVQLEANAVCLNDPVFKARTLERAAEIRAVLKAAGLEDV